MRDYNLGIHFKPVYKVTKFKAGPRKGKTRLQCFPPPFIKNMTTFRSVLDEHIDAHGYMLDVLAKIPTRGDLTL